MLLSQLINPAELVRLTPVQMQLLATKVQTDMLSVPTVKRQMAASADKALKALKLPKQR